MIGIQQLADWCGDTCIHRELFINPAVFPLELDRIFNRTWIYVAHTSELPNIGDYRLAHIGTQSVIVSRGEDGVIRVFINACRHRGVPLVSAEHGCARSHICPYHGWMYDCGGNLRKVPQAGGQPPNFKLEDFGLLRVPRVDAYRGFVFACFSSNAPSLTDHLGAAREFIDLFSDLSPTGEVCVNMGATRYEYIGNWKQQVENSMDGYHVAITHGSFLKSILRARIGQSMEGLVDETSGATSVALGQGHALLDYRAFDRQKIMGRSGPPSAATTAWHAMLRERLGGPRAEVVIRCNGGDGFNLLVYPNLMLINNQIRVVVPMAFNRTRVLAFPVGLSGVAAEVNAQRLRAHEDFYGTAAFGAADDIEMFERQWQGLTQSPSNEWLHYARGITREARLPTGEFVGHVSDETGQRGIWRRWREFMVAAE